MLKIYKVHNYVSIDGADWREVLWSGLSPIEHKVFDEPPETRHILCNASFYEAYDYVHNNRLDGVYESSLCLSRMMIWPAIKIRYRDAYDNVTYRNFISMSYKIEYEEWKNVTLEWIIKHLSADQTIQYLKERGITTCPMNF